MDLFNLGNTDLSGALGSAPTGLYSGLNPGASAGAFQGSPLGGGLAGQMAGSSPVVAPSGNSNPLAAMLLMQQAGNSASQIGQQSPIQDNNFQAYANPVATVTPAMLGRALMGK